MKKTKTILLTLILLMGSLTWASSGLVNLGQSSVSLHVKDIKKSNEFYQKLGFEEAGGDINQKWLILTNRTNNSVIGIFQGHFNEKFMLTYNPSDVRFVQRQLKEQGIKFIKEADEGDGPAHAVIEDPDGNRILLDQHN